MTDGVRGISQIADSLVAIAATGGERHLLDTKEEIDEARGLLERELALRKGHGCEADILKKAIKSLKSGRQSYQPHRLFQDLLDYRCRGFQIFGRWFGMGSVDINLLTPLEKGAYATFYVYHHGGGWQTHLEEAQVTQEEWLRIISPITAPQRFGDATDEIIAIGETVAQFEKIIGPKAGTEKDVGGFFGNDIIVNHYEMALERKNDFRSRAKGQQDCINETQTTRGLIDVLIRQGLVTYHELRTDDSVITLGKNQHVTALLYRKEDESSWVVDSWPRDNGEPPDTWPVDVWLEHWSRIIFPPEVPAVEPQKVIAASKNISTTNSQTEWKERRRGPF